MVFVVRAGLALDVGRLHRPGFGTSLVSILRLHARHISGQGVDECVQLGAGLVGHSSTIPSQGEEIGIIASTCLWRSFRLPDSARGKRGKSARSREQQAAQCFSTGWAVPDQEVLLRGCFIGSGWNDKPSAASVGWLAGLKALVGKCGLAFAQALG